MPDATSVAATPVAATSARPGRLVVVTPWYPTAANPYWGTFVRETTRALAPQFPDPLVVHLEAVGDDMPAGTTRQVEDGLEVLRLRVPAPGALPRAEVATRMRDALAPHADELRQAVAVHAHVGIPAAWGVVDLVGADVPVVVSEHASYLNRVFADERASRMYHETVAGARALTTVGPHLSHVLHRRFADLPTPVRTVPNPVDLTRFEARSEPVHALDRWLYVGNLLEAKGALRLVRAFAAWRAERPTATLTVAGDGVDRPRVEALAAALGVADAVTLLGRVAPEDVPPLYRKADVLVHLSRAETFGLTAVEALASGLPVVATATDGARANLDVAQDTWTAWLVELGDDVEPVLAGVRGLEARLGASRFDLAREDVERRFGTQAVAAALGAVLRGEPVQVPTDGPLVVALALHTSVLRRASRVVSDAARRGAHAVLVTDWADDVEVDERVEVVEVGPRRRRISTHRLERWTIDGVPRVAVAAARPVSRLVGQERLVDQVDQSARRFGTWWRRAIGERAMHAHLDPLVLARHVLEEHGDRLADPVLVVWGDPRGIPLAARLARAHPDAVVVASASHELVVELLDRLAAATPDVEASSSV